MLTKRTWYRFRRLITVMLPVLATQLSIIGMNFFDATMSGHAGAEQLAGTSIGGSLMMPIIASATGILMAATPIIAQLIGKNQKENIDLVIRSGLVLACIIEIILLLSYHFFIDK
ncbi:MAG: MATE family efflux transporter, partial [Firmicutes bacterium]|nr:MATE family efflux transporter [Candidatus Alectryobacillus merdavium]